jgi:hypothetical protein
MSPDFTGERPVGDGFFVDAMIENALSKSEPSLVLEALVPFLGMRAGRVVAGVDYEVVTVGDVMDKDKTRMNPSAQNAAACSSVLEPDSLSPPSTGPAGWYSNVASSASGVSAGAGGDSSAAVAASIEHAVARATAGDGHGGVNAVIDGLHAGLCSQ